MHMADALISPAAGGVMWAAAAGTAAYSIKKIQDDMDEKKIPLMGVMGAFVFAAQMVNFTIPGTGSSGHLGGGLLLSALLGPYAGFLTMASILIIQALFFADGGLLALGCNIFNLGFFTCFIAYPLIYKRLLKKAHSPVSILGASVLSAVIGLQMGAFSVVVETVLSGKTELPFEAFLLLMQSIHLAIGIVEGFVTAAVVSFVWKAQPEILEKVETGAALGSIPVKMVVVGIAIAAVITGGVLSLLASSRPDGLEWSISKVTGREELQTGDGIHQVLADIQDKTAILPGYGFKDEEENKNSESVLTDSSKGTSVSGIVGGVLTLAVTALIGTVINLVKKGKKQRPQDVKQ